MHVDYIANLTYTFLHLHSCLFNFCTKIYGFMDSVEYISLSNHFYGIWVLKLGVIKCIKQTIIF
jgi:hypothetical protein